MKTQGCKMDDNQTQSLDRDDFALDVLGPVDWEKRLGREGPALLEMLTSAPSKRVLDLGSATGEHCRWLAAQGFEAVGIEASEPKVEQARQESHEDNPTYLLGDIGAVEAGARGQFGAAFCLGDTLSALVGTENLARMLVGLRRRLLPGAPLILHLHNYERIYAQGQRHLPLLFTRNAQGEDLLTLRLLEPRDDGIVILSTSALRPTLGGEPALEVLESRNAYLQAWTHDQLLALLEVAHFPDQQAFGSWALDAFLPMDSEELLIVAR